MMLFASRYACMHARSKDLAKHQTHCRSEGIAETYLAIVDKQMVMRSLGREWGWKDEAVMRRRCIIVDEMRWRSRERSWNSLPMWPRAWGLAWH
jgi:hypothetical protein